MVWQEENATQTLRLVAAAIGFDVGFLLAKLHSTGSALNNAALAEFGLKERSFSVLTLGCSGLEPTQRELADFLSLDPSQIVSLVDNLERLGLVERIAGTRDRRSKSITATAEGHKIEKAAKAALKACEARQLAALTPGESADLKRLLRKAVWPKA